MKKEDAVAQEKHKNTADEMGEPGETRSELLHQGARGASQGSESGYAEQPRGEQLAAAAALSTFSFFHPPASPKSFSSAGWALCTEPSRSPCAT